MKKSLLLLATLSSTLFMSHAFAGQTPAIEIKIEGRAKDWVEPKLVLEDKADEFLPLSNESGLWIYGDAAAGSYILTLVDKQNGETVYEQAIHATLSGDHLTNAFRSIDCSVHNGEIVCLDLL